MSVRTNVVVVIADDMGWGDLGVQNDGRSSTPHLDELARSGTRLTQHYSGSPVCSPARASLLTGRYPHRTGAIDTLHGRGLDRLGLGETTIADVFRASGYRTGLVGKWHNGALDPRFHPNARGFDEFVGFSGGWSDYWDYHLDVDGSERPGDGRYLTEVLTEHAVEFVRRHATRPFLLIVAYNAPHFPMQAPDALVEQYEARGATHGEALTYAMIEVMDAGIGRLCETLAELGLEENTLVLFTSDNGPYLGEVQGVSLDRFNGGLRGAKHDVWEGGIRVPTIVRWPAGLDPGDVVDEPTHFTDWLPTLAAVAEAPVPADLRLDGRDVLDVLRGRSEDAGPMRFWQNNRYAPNVAGNGAVRDGDWKLVRPPIAELMQVTEADRVVDRSLNARLGDRIDRVDASALPVFVPEAAPPVPQLFDLGSDPGEERDLASADPDRVERLTAELEGWFASVERDRLSAVTQ